MSYFLCCFDEFMSSNLLIQAPSFTHDMQESCICQRRRSSCIGRLSRENTSSMLATQNLSRDSVGFSMIFAVEFRMDVSIRDSQAMLEVLLSSVEALDCLTARFVE